MLLICPWNYITFYLIILGHLATISPVLFANMKHPYLKKEVPDWPTRAKHLARIWRKLGSEERIPYLVSSEKHLITMCKIPVQAIQWKKVLYLYLNLLYSQQKARDNRAFLKAARRESELPDPELLSQELPDQDFKGSQSRYVNSDELGNVFWFSTFIVW